MHIALVSETFVPEVNGVAMTISRMVDALRERRHRVSIVRPRQAVDANGNTDSADLKLVTPVPIPKYSNLRFGLVLPGTLKKRWRNDRPDLVHIVTEGPLGVSALFAARSLGIPVTSGFHTNFDSYTAHYGIPFFKNVVDGYLRWFHNRTEATLVPTAQLASQLTSRGYLNTRVVSRGIDVALFNPQRRSDALRQQWGIKDQELICAFVGRLAEEKNIDLVIRAYKAIQNELPTARMLFVGHGPRRAQIETECPNAIFAGERRGEDLAAHYASADMFLFPSLTETFGNVTIEALASGLAVVAYNDAAAAEHIRDGDNGRIVEPGDETAYVQAAVEVARDAAARRSLRDAAAPSICHLTWDAIHDSVEHIMSRCAGHPAITAPATGFDGRELADRP